MASFQDPTPCPARGTRLHAQQHRTSSILGHSMGGLQNVKPRRPRASNKPTVGWDPTVDIFEDTFELHKCLAPAASAPTDGAAPTRGPAEFSIKPSRRSSLLMQPAQKMPLDAQKSDLSMKRRKISTLPEVDETCAIHISPAASTSIPHNQPQGLQITRAPRRSTIFKSVVDPSGEGETTKMLRPFERTSTEKTQQTTKDPRRQTIFIPSEDTTLYTIHPGNSSRNKAQAPRKIRRSDIFLDIAETAAEKEDGRKQELDEAPARRLTRKSLAAAPQRAPLHGSKCQAQANVIFHDRPGTGGGKENIPPGGFAKQAKHQPSLDATVGLDLTSVLGPKPIDTGKKETQKSTLAENTACLFPKLQTASSKSVLGPSSGNLATNHQSKSHDQAPAGSNLKRAPRRSTLGGASLMKFEASNTGAKMSGNQRTSTFRPSIDPLKQYRAISENVSTPALFEDNWLGHQETTITQLINGLLENAGNPENAEVKLSSQELRSEVLALYQDQTLVLLYKRLQASLQFGGLSLPKDRLSQVSRFRDDLAQKQRFLDLWLKTYRLEYLQAAAEAVIGREIIAADRSSGGVAPPATTGQSRSKSKSIEGFLKVCLVNNEDFSGSSSKLRDVEGLNHEQDPEIGSTAGQWRRTVVRSLMLVLMLDKAKESGRFKCSLFQTSSPFKTSCAVLQALCMLLLPSIGDPLRILAHVNYQVSHVQHALNEYDYRIRNLATDLRDGVILTRLIENLLFPGGSTQSHGNQDETVTMPWGENLTLVVGAEQEPSWVLSQHLKHPCISRVQKMFNVQIAMSALETAKDSAALLEGVSADDIVDGHREKTVGFLWSLVSRWGLAALVNFEIVQRETRRLEKVYKSGRISETTADAVDTEQQQQQQQQDSGHLQSCADLLQAWARSVCRLHGITVSNLSTSFADGIAYHGIIQEYAPYVVVAATAADTSEAAHQQGEASSGEKSKRTGSVAAATLQAMGCSKAFVNLFQNTSTIPTAETTIPLLAFLASRLVSAAQPHIAASTIQRSWRVYTARRNLHRRVKLAALARDAAVVVGIREKILGAALTIQRAWRRYNHSISSL